MFTGIVQKTAKVKDSRKDGGSLILEIEKPKNFPIKLGSSIATNGVCLTVNKISKNSYATELMKETLKTTAFGESVPKELNLELSLKFGDKIDGHFVLGHVDSVGIVKEIKKFGRSKQFVIKHPKKFSRLVIPKGSVAVNGVSLTIASCKPGEFSVNLVDFTLKNTTFQKLSKNDAVNIEYDMLGKYLFK